MDLKSSVTTAGTLETVAIPGSTPQAITQFSDDTLGTKGAEINPIRDFTTFTEAQIPGVEDIKRFLERPTILTQGNLSTSDSGIMYSIDPFHQLVTTSKAAKLNGIYGIRADVKISLFVNASRFQTGRYILGFVPSGGLPIANAGFVAFNKMHAGHLVQRTQCPHVEIDVATQTHVEFVIPWQGMFPFFVNLSTYPVGLGSLFLCPYVALSAASGDSAAGFTIMASFQNIFLTGPTYTQSGFSAAEQKAAGIGPIGTNLAKVSQATSILGELPLIGDMAREVSWTASVLARAANVFGWSKPLHLSTSTPVIQRPYRYMASSDGEAVSEVIAGVATNAVDAHPALSGTKVDEMAIDYLKQIYALYSTVTWDATGVADTVLFNIPVSPFVLTNMTNGFAPTPVGYLSTMFQQWRGSMKYRFKFVKNEFYSGRVAIRYEPNWHGTNVTTTLTASEYSHRVIVDLREASEFEVVVPYVSSEMYTSITNNIGTLIMVILDPLVVPSTVPSAMTIIAEVSGGDDLEFARPQVPAYEPWVPAVTQSGFSKSGPEPIQRFYLGSEAAPKSLTPACVAPGEKLESLRQLAKIANPKIFLTATNSSWSMLSGNMSRIRPFRITAVTQATSNTTPVNRDNTYADWHDYISSCYSLQTGAVRIICSPQTAGVQLQAGAGESTSTAAFYESGAPSLQAARQMRSLTETGHGAPADFYMPSYQQTIGRSVAANLASIGAPALSSGYAMNRNLLVRNSAAADIIVSIWRVPADDWNCYGFVSCPLIWSITQA